MLHPFVSIAEPELAFVIDLPTNVLTTNPSQKPLCPSGIEAVQKQKRIDGWQMQMSPVEKYVKKQLHNWTTRRN